ncbi:MAG: hypothetical protein ACTSWN_04400, partial [Promethearchaeota archaeon]
MVLVAGIDFGSSLIKAASSGQIFIAPSMIGEYNEGWSGMASDKTWENNLCVHVGIDPDGKVYKQFFGELARLQSEVVRVLTKG